MFGCKNSSNEKYALPWASIGSLGGLKLLAPSPSSSLPISPLFLSVLSSLPPISAPSATSSCNIQKIMTNTCFSDWGRSSGETMDPRVGQFTYFPRRGFDVKNLSSIKMSGKSSTFKRLPKMSTAATAKASRLT